MCLQNCMDWIADDNVNKRQKIKICVQFSCTDNLIWIKYDSISRTINTLENKWSCLCVPWHFINSDDEKSVSVFLEYLLITNTLLWKVPPYCILLIETMITYFSACFCHDTMTDLESVCTEYLGTIVISVCMY